MVSRHTKAIDSAPIKAKENKATQQQRTITANAKELKSITARNKKWTKDQNQRQGSNNKRSHYTSNKTHYSPTDPDITSFKKLFFFFIFYNY